MANPISIIDAQTADIAKSLDMVVAGFEGLFEKMARDNPTSQGLGQYWIMTTQMVAEATQVIILKINAAKSELITSLSVPEQFYLVQQHDSDYSDQTAYSAIGSFLDQSRVAFAKRLRNIIAAHAFGKIVGTSKVDVWIMDRSGRRWNFSEFAYLTTRQILIDWYNQVKIAYMVSVGYTEFKLDTIDPNFVDNVYQIADYPELAQSLFHPRTTKLVGSPNVQS